MTVPNKTIYVADADLPLLERAQELSGGNLSAAVVKALRRMVEVAEERLEGYDEIKVRVGPGKGRIQRFVGVLLVEWSRSSRDREEEYRVYLSRTGKYVVHLKRGKEWVHRGGADGNATGLLRHLSPDQAWGSTTAAATLDVYDTLDDLRGKIPDQLYDLVATAAEIPVIEDLDI